MPGTSGEEMGSDAEEKKKKKAKREVLLSRYGRGQLRLNPIGMFWETVQTMPQDYPTEVQRSLTLSSNSHPPRAEDCSLGISTDTLT